MLDDLEQCSNRLQIHFWLIVCSQKAKYKWRSYHADMPLVRKVNVSALFLCITIIYLIIYRKK